MKSKLLKQKIKESGVTQAHIARLLGLTRTGLSNKINSKTKFSAVEAIQIMRILQLTFDDFLEIFEDR